jgi:hypothetical protein
MNARHDLVSEQTFIVGTPVGSIRVQRKEWRFPGNVLFFGSFVVQGAICEAHAQAHALKQ